MTRLHLIGSQHDAVRAEETGPAPAAAKSTDLCFADKAARSNSVAKSGAALRNDFDRAAGNNEVGIDETGNVVWSVMPEPIHQLSELIGRMSAQLTYMNTQLSETRSEILTNRDRNEGRAEDFARRLDQLSSDFREVRHLERNIEQANVAVHENFVKLTARIEELEDTIGAWKNRTAGVVAVLSLLGSVLLVMLGEMVKRAVGAWTE